MGELGRVEEYSSSPVCVCVCMCVCVLGVDY